jgi:hypothetical protein
MSLLLLTPPSTPIKYKYTTSIHSPNSKTRSLNPPTIDHDSDSINSGPVDCDAPFPRHLLLTRSPPPARNSSNHATALSAYTNLRSCSDFFPSFADFLPPIDSVESFINSEGINDSLTAFGHLSVGEMSGLGIIFEEERGTVTAIDSSGGAGKYHHSGERMVAGLRRSAPDLDSNSAPLDSTPDSFTFFPSPSFISESIIQSPTRYYPTPPVSRSSPTLIRRRLDHDQPNDLRTSPDRLPSSYSRHFDSKRHQSDPTIQTSLRPTSRSLSSSSPEFFPSFVPSSLKTPAAPLNQRSSYLCKTTFDLEGYRDRSESIKIPDTPSIEEALTILSRTDIDLVRNLHGGRIPTLAQMVPPDPMEDVFISNYSSQPEIINTGNQGRFLR